MRNTRLKKSAQILVACREVAYGNTLTRFLQADHHSVESCFDTQGLLRNISRRVFDVIVLDMELGDEADLNLVSFARRRHPDVQIVLLFDVAKLERALDGIRQGAFFYLPKNCQPSDVVLVVGKAIQHTETTTTLDQYEQNAFEELVGGTAAMRRVVELITKVAPTDSTVLLLGESGTGKELLANAVHRLSRRRDKPFVAINCAALPENLLESEMFGHVKGSFTGADSDKRGLFEEADGGSIFLDEIGDMAPITQAKLLRVLQNGEIRPVGASVSRRIDVRVIAATNRDLIEAVRTYKFREDLYFRLNVIQISIPPLRDRLDALPALVNHFLARYNMKYEKHIRAIDEQVQILLRNYTYPGNVRELESIIAHAVILCEGDTLTAHDLPDQVRTGVTTRLALPDHASDYVATLIELEENAIRETLNRLDGNQSEAARRLGISRSTLWRKMKEYGIPAAN